MRAEHERAHRVRAVFEAVVELSAQECTEHLAGIAQDDPALAAEVEELVAHDCGEEAICEVVGSVAASYQEPRERPGSTIGPYRLVGELGRGGMGTVWLAERDDDAYRAEVAIKLLRGATDPQLRARFKAERQILATLEHPNIARLLDGGTTPDGSPFVVMEYVRGVPIDVYCEENGLAVEDRLELFCQVCLAVQHAHQNLIVHRDLKPTNILVDAQGVPKLLDFGVAKLLDASRLEDPPPETRSGSQWLTPQYASPEQIRGEPITTVADVYALGVLLHHLLTGGLPYRLTSSDPRELARAVCDSEPVPPSVAIQADHDRPTAFAGLDGTRLVRRLEGDLDNIVSKAMRKEPRHRYGSPEKLAEDIRRHLQLLPVVARPATLRYRAGRFINRHRWRVAAATATVVMLIAATVFSFAQMRLAVQASEVAERERSVAVGQALRATLSAASARIEAGEPLEALTFLESVGEAERGWEWRYLRTELERPLLVVSGSDALTAALSADGRSLISIAADGRLEWRDLLGETLVRVDRLETTGAIRLAAFSADGNRVAVADGALGRRISLWDVAVDAEPRAVLTASLPEPVTGIALAASGVDLVATTARATWVWREDGAQPRVFSYGASPEGVTTSADGSYVVLLESDREGSYRVLDPGRPELLDVTRGRDVIGMALSPDGRLAAGGETDRWVRIRETVSGRVVERLSGHTGRPNALAFAPGGRFLASAAPNDVRVWDLETSTLVDVFPGPERVRELRFGARGERLIAVSGDGDLWAWRVRYAAPDSSSAASVAYAHDGSRAWTLSYEGHLSALDHESGVLFDAADLGALEATAMVVSSDDRWLLTLENGTPLARRTSAPTASAPLLAAGPRVVAIASASSEPRFATLDASGEVIVWEPDSWTPVVRMNGGPAPGGSLALSADGSRLVSTHQDGARVWDATAGALIRIVPELEHAPTSAAYRPDDTQFAIGRSDGSIRLVDVGRWEEDEIVTPHRTAVSVLTYAPDGARLVSGADDGTLWISDPERARALLELRAHRGRVEGVAFAPDGTKLLSAGLGGLRVWDATSARVQLLAAERLRKARWAMEPLVSELLARTPDPEAVSRALREDPTLGVLERRAALQIALSPELPNAAVGRGPLDGFAFESASRDSYVRVEAHESLRMTPSFTVEAWVQPLPVDSAASGPGTVINKEGEYQIALSREGRVSWIISGPNGWLSPWRRTRYRIPVGTWAHLALVRDGTTVRFHINGRAVQSVQVPEGIGDHHPDMDELRLLGRQHTPASLHGRIDEVRIWSVARTEQEIGGAMLRRVEGDEPGLVAAWSFEEGVGSVAGDATGRHPGSLVEGGWSRTRK